MNIIDNKVKNLKLQFKKDLEEANADTIDLLRGQKTEIDNLKIKIVQLDEEIEELARGVEDEQSEEDDGSGSSREDALSISQLASEILEEPETAAMVVSESN